MTLPQIRPGIVTGSIFAFISSWINVELSIFNTTADLNTIPVKLFNYVQYTIDPTIAAVSGATIAAAVIAIVILDLTVGWTCCPNAANEPYPTPSLEHTPCASKTRSTSSIPIPRASPCASSSGIPYPAGSTILEKRAFLEQRYDWLRKALMREPRGQDMFGVFLTPPSSPSSTPA